MTSIERVLRMLRVLMRPKGATVQELSRRFGRDLKTIRRDLLAIQRAGFRLQSSRDNQQGRKRWRVALTRRT